MRHCSGWAVVPGVSGGPSGFSAAHGTETLKVQDGLTTEKLRHEALYFKNSERGNYEVEVSVIGSVVVPVGQDVKGFLTSQRVNRARPPH